MAAGKTKTGKRPFWAHQLVEYILGAALVASGLQSPQPIVPAVVGGFLLLYAAATRGALAAFRLIHRRVHRVADPVLIVAQVGAALQQWVSVDNGTRIIMFGIAFVHLVVWLGSSFTENEKEAKPSAVAFTAAGTAAGTAQPAGDRSTELGRSAGRWAAKGVRAVRAARASREDK